MNNTKEKPKIIFMGTPEFAVPALAALQEVFGVIAVVTIPDKPQGRGKKILPSAVKVKAIELDIPLLQPESLKSEDFISELKKYEPDIIVVIAFRILPKEVFTISKIGTFNIHASLLPKYRGAAPINWAIINGEEITGLTSFLIEEKVDTGNIILQEIIKIPDGATAGDLHDLMMPLAADLSMKTYELLIKNDYKLKLQDNSLASPAPKIFTDQCKINWSQPSIKLRNFIHGVSPFPGAWTLWNEDRLKILRVEFKTSQNGNPGEYFIGNGEFHVFCNAGFLLIKELQIQGKKAMKIEEFLRGYRGDDSGKFV